MLLYDGPVGAYNFLFGPRTWSVTVMASMGLQDNVRGSANEGFGEDHSCGIDSALCIGGSDWVQVVAVDVRGMTNS